jgi:hypothetical protein
MGRLSSRPIDQIRQLSLGLIQNGLELDGVCNTLLLQDFGVSFRNPKRVKQAAIAVSAGSSCTFIFG